MPIMAFIGKQGSGKTNSMVVELLKNHLLGMKIYTNIKLIGIPYNKLDMNFFYEYLEENKELENVCVGIDEIHLFADSYEYKSNLAKVLNYFALQTRKRNVKFYYTTQYFENITRRLRRVTLDDVLVLCNGVYDGKILFNNRMIDKLIRVEQTILHDSCSKVTNMVLEHPENFFKYYQTEQIIDIIKVDKKKSIENGKAT